MYLAICEDNQEEASGLQTKIKHWAAKQNITIKLAIFENAEQFWFFYEESAQLDALILDIQMPGESGITLAKKLREKKNAIPILFITGVDEYISEGYDVQAVHYLLKPVQTQKLEECLNRLWRLRKEEEPFVLLQTENGIVRLLQKDIVMVEIFAHECVYTTAEKIYTVTGTLREAKDKLKKEWFVHAHRSILINLLQVEAITHTKVYLKSGKEATVSRRMYSNLNQAFIQLYQDRTLG